MVLSLPFILAIVGASVGLLVGILIFGEVSEAIECPVGTGSPAIPPSPSTITSYNNFGTLGFGGDAVYYEFESPSVFQSIQGKINQAVIVNGTDSGKTNGEIYLGLSSGSWDFLTFYPSGSDLVSINMWVNANYSTWFVGNCPLCIDYDDPIEHNLLSNGNRNALPFFNLHIEKGDGYSDIFAVVKSLSGDEPVNAISDPAPSNGQWHMITLQYDKAGSKKICRDAICSAGSTFGSFSSGGSTDLLTIGSDSDHYYYTFNFPTNNIPNVKEITLLIDDVTIWNGYSLTQTDINDLYNGGTGVSAGSSGLGLALASQVGHWNFDLSSANGSPATPGSPGSLGGSGTGNVECENAKDTAWTVIGILPVALFFGLFALFSTIMPRPT